MGNVSSRCWVDAVAERDRRGEDEQVVGWIGKQTNGWADGQTNRRAVEK